MVNVYGGVVVVVGGWRNSVWMVRECMRMCVYV